MNMFRNKNLRDITNSNEKSKLLRICVVTAPFGDQKSATAGHEILSNFLKILVPLSCEMFVITGNFPENRVRNKKIHVQNINRHTEESMFWKVLKHIWTQLTISIEFVKVSKNIDIAIFYFGGATLLFPMLSAKLIRKKVVLFTPGSRSKDAAKIYNTRLFGMGGVIFSCILRMLEYVNFHLADQIVVESEGAIDFMGLNKYRKKLSANCTLYINFDLFKVKKDFKDRRNLIGYTGRLSAEKGVLNFVKAIPLILKERGDLEFLICGDGPLFDEIKKELKNNGSYNKVELTGWISHDELPKYLNELKLIVAPSYTEGGVPTVIMEAMACGTVSLVTPVAGVDVIKDGESGFILEDNSPECIAKNVIRVLEHPNLDEIVNNACNLVEEEFSYEKVVKQYRDMLYGLLYK